MHPQLLADTGRSCGTRGAVRMPAQAIGSRSPAHHGSDDDAGIAFTRFTEAYADLNDRDEEAPCDVAAGRQEAVVAEGEVRELVIGGGWMISYARALGAPDRPRYRLAHPCPASCVHWWSYSWATDRPPWGA